MWQLFVEIAIIIIIVTTLLPLLCMLGSCDHFWCLMHPYAFSSNCFLRISHFLHKWGWQLWIHRWVPCVWALASYVRILLGSSFLLSILLCGLVSIGIARSLPCSYHRRPNTPQKQNEQQQPIQPFSQTKYLTHPIVHSPHWQDVSVRLKFEHLSNNYCSCRCGGWKQWAWKCGDTEREREREEGEGGNEGQRTKWQFAEFHTILPVCTSLICEAAMRLEMQG